MTPNQNDEQPSEDSSFPSPALSGQDLLLWSALPDLTLNIAQTAALCGVSVRQLGYWTKQGYVTAAGKGARRFYGPASLRRILAIRQSMINGLSLRQSLRALDAASSAAPSSVGLASMIGDGKPAEADPLSPAEIEAVSSDILGLLQGNRETRDDAHGLSAKLGRAEETVRHAADSLTVMGALQKSLAGIGAVYSLANRRSK